MIKIKRLMVCLLLPLYTMGLSMAQERINEFVVNVDENHDPMTLYSSYGATANDGVVIVNSTIQDLEFNIPAAPGRIRTIPDKKKNRYVLIIQPNDSNYQQYTITINAKGFVQGKINNVVVKAGLSSGFIVNTKYEINRYSIGDDAKDFIGIDGFKIAHLDASGKHGFAIKYDSYTEFPYGYAIPSQTVLGPTITELRMMNANRYKLGLYGEYWSSTYAGGGNGLFNLSRNYTFDYSTGTTNERRTGKNKYKKLTIIRF